MKQAKNLLILFLLGATVNAKAQVGIGTITPDASAQLDVSSTTKGFLPPRMTAAQRSAISSPTNGLLVYQTDYPSGLYYFNSGVWSSVAVPTHYPSVTICNQKWMDKNLDVITYRNGDPIAYVTDPTAWAALTSGAWCYYNNDPSTNATYGKLYNWYAVNDSRGLAPAGWHVPSDAEWTTLETCLGGSPVAGGKMKVTGTTAWTSANPGATNSSGFAALPGGYRNIFTNGTFLNVSIYGYWWSTTELITTDTWSRTLYYNSGDIGRYQIKKGAGVICSLSQELIYLIHLIIYPASRVEIFENLALFSDLPVYKVTFDLLLAIFRFAKDFSKDYKYTVGRHSKTKYIH